MHAGQDLLGVRVSVLSVIAATLAVSGALVSLALGFLIYAEDFGDVVPRRWLVVFAATSLGTVVLFLLAVATGRSATDARFLWEAILSLVVAGAFALATSLDDGFPGYLLLASVLAAYVTLARWTWSTWRAG
jgi:O-antigen/teichoic acid export membrane protein